MATVDYSFHLVEMQKVLKVLGERCLKAAVSSDAQEFAEINELVDKFTDHCEEISMWALDGFRKDVR